jgi:IS30 family transposase
MASRLGFHPSTILREIRRAKPHSTALGYRADLGEKWSVSAE